MCIPTHGLRNTDFRLRIRLIAYNANARGFEIDMNSPINSWPNGFRDRPFAANSSVHLVKKFEWQLIFFLNTLIFISQTHMQKFFTYFPAVFF